jgi:hypothetical protein
MVLSSLLFPAVFAVIQLAATDSLGALLRARIAQVPGAQVGIAYWSLARADTMLIDADTEFHAASTMKVPVMIEVFRQADAERLTLDQNRPLVNQFASIVDGSPYSRCRFRHLRLHPNWNTSLNPLARRAHDRPLQQSGDECARVRKL